MAISCFPLIIVPRAIMNIDYLIHRHKIVVENKDFIYFCIEET